jgi:hypothetical protein
MGSDGIVVAVKEEKTLRANTCHPLFEAFMHFQRFLE